MDRMIGLNQLGADIKIIKEGYLIRYNASQLILNKTSTDYYLLTRGSLDCYNNDKCEKLKRRYDLAVITNINVKVLNEFAITLLHHPVVVFRTVDEDECKEWVSELSDAVEKWRDTGEDLFESTTTSKSPNIFPTLIYSEECMPMDLRVHNELPMIKYSRVGNVIPHERIFKMDEENMQILWRRTGKRSVMRSFSWNCSLFIGDIVEIRSGQQTRNFNQYPYLEVENQSFSLIFEKEQGEWCGLTSLDIICDSVTVCNNWKGAMKILVYGLEDKKSLRDLYLVMDPLLIFLKRYWSIQSEDKVILVDSCTNFMWKFHQHVKKRVLRNFIREIALNQYSEEYLNWESFLFLFNILIHKRELYDEYRKYAVSYEHGMTPTEFFKFLRDVQKVQHVDLPMVIKLIRYHDKHHRVYKRNLAGDNPQLYQQSSIFLSFHGFVSYLRSADNDILNVNLKQDMTYPLCHYFIDSSHNTYLVGHQLKGLSSCEAYVYSLLKGSRCLEIDCWDGPDGPVVTHGMTLTTKIKFRHVVETIKAYAFEASPYPVILSLENHCSAAQQEMMAQQFTDIMGDMLAIEDFCENNTLPSPEQLKYKIILKGRAQIRKKKKYSSGKTIRKISQLSRSGGSSGSTGSGDGTTNSPKFRNQSVFLKTKSISQTSSASGEEETSSANSPIRNQSVLLRTRTVSQTSASGEEDTSLHSQYDEPPEGELEEIPLAELMSSLIVYCKSRPYKPDNRTIICSEMHSFNENSAIELGDSSPLKILTLSQQKLLRSYPRGTRVESSNYNPMLMWQIGIQMAAINIQKPDFGTHINTGYFKKSNGTGYILKPSVMIKRASQYHPKMTNSISSQKVTVDIICGQFVDPEMFGGFPIFVEIQTVGIDASNTTFSTEITANTFNPVWHEKCHTVDIVMPSLCLLYFKVYAVGRINKLVYQNCFPVDLLRPGVRYVPMKTITGTNKHENGLFVNLNIALNAYPKPQKNNTSSSKN